jgi:hypothetical protein
MVKRRLTSSNENSALKICITRLPPARPAVIPRLIPTSLTCSSVAGQPKTVPDAARDLTALRRPSIRSERCYCDWIFFLIRYQSKRFPRETGDPVVTAFLTYLAREGNVAASTQNQALSALFLDKKVLKVRNTAAT